MAKCLFFNQAAANNIISTTQKNHQPPVQINKPLQHKTAMNNQALKSKIAITANPTSFRFSTMTPSRFCISITVPG